MVVKKAVSLTEILSFAGHHFIWLTAWSVSVACLYYFTDFKQFSIPMLPLSLIGTAVAFYVGFKNNQAYDRVWEARKIWGGIVNSSRSWGSMAKHFVKAQNAAQPVHPDEISTAREGLIYRHIAWLYTLRSQLLVNTGWEHVNLKGVHGKFGRQRQKQFGTGLFEDETTETNGSKYLPEGELEKLAHFENGATHIIDKQAEELARLRTLNLLDDFRHIELQKVLNDFYGFQGMAERIKKFPLPRQYANASFIFICLFIFMLPFGMVSEFAKLGAWGIWLSVPFMVIVGWIFVVMELVGDYSENPFEGLATDVPMLAICRTIEIDLLQMLGERNVPKPIGAKNGILM